MPLESTMEVQVYEWLKAIKINLTFHFSTVVPAGVEKEMKSLNASKVGKFQNIPTHCLKDVLM